MKYPCCKCCCGGICRYDRSPLTGHTEPCPREPLHVTVAATFKRHTFGK